MLQIYFLFVGR